MKVTFEVPTLWADHHVLQVRDALVNLAGVEKVYASSAWKQVLVTYNNKKTKKADIEKALGDAGYPVGEGGVPILVQSSNVQRDPQWAGMNLRITETNMVDLEMSGEFRKY